MNYQIHINTPRQPVCLLLCWRFYLFSLACISFLVRCLSVNLSFCLPRCQCHHFSQVLMKIFTNKRHLYVYIRFHQSLLLLFGPPRPPARPPLFFTGIFFLFSLLNAAGSRSAAATSHLLLAWLLAWRTVTHIHTQTPHTPDGVLSTPCFSERTKRYHLAKISFHRGNTTLRCYAPAETLKLLFRMIFFNKVDGVFPLKAPMCKLLFNLITTP